MLKISSKFTVTKINQAGMYHLLVPVIIVLAVASVGAYVISRSSAVTNEAAYTGSDLGYYPAEPQGTAGPSMEPNVPVYDGKVSNTAITAQTATVKNSGANVINLVTFNYAHFKPTSGIAPAVKTISQKFGAAVMGMQEFGSDEHRAALIDVVNNCKECNLGAYVPPAKLGSSVPIVWNKNKVTAIAKGTQKVYDAQRVEDGAGGSNVNSKYVNWVIFKENATGQKFVFINTHLIPTVESNGSPIAAKPLRVGLYKKHIATIVAINKRFTDRGMTTFLTGDFNVNYLADSKVRSTAFPFKNFDNENMWANWRLKSPPSTGTISGKNRVIDYIYSSRNQSGTFRIQNTRTLPSQGSDHLPTMATYGIYTVGASAL